MRLRLVSAVVHAFTVDSSQDVELLWLPSHPRNFHAVLAPQESKGAGSLHGTKSPGVSGTQASHTCPNADTDTCVHLCAEVMAVFIFGKILQDENCKQKR
jgi:hypothetical protein